MSSIQNLSGNWEFASTSSTPSSTLPTAGLLLLGSLISSGSNVSGIFRLANLSTPNSCGTPLQQVVTVSGTVDSSRNLTLTSAAFSGSVLTMQLVVPPALTSVGSGSALGTLNGTIAVTGGSCTFSATTAFGFEIVPVTGTFAGPVTANTYLSTPPILTGTATLTLTQATVSQSDGQFPVTGTLAFSGGGCTSSVAVSGLVSGPSLTLSTPLTSPFLTSTDTIRAIVDPVNAQMDVQSLIYGLGPCNAGVISITDFNGNLTKQ